MPDYGDYDEGKSRRRRRRRSKSGYPKQRTPVGPGLIVSYCALFGGIMTLIVGMVHLFVNVEAELEWPTAGKSFVSDHNRATYRLSAFTLAPDFFADHWTALALGAISLYLHAPKQTLRIVTCTYLRFGIWNLFVALYGDFGYAGGFGILVGSLKIIICVACLVTGALQKKPMDAGLCLQLFKSPSQREREERRRKSRDDAYEKV
uniref:Uncharacterized protein n=1 Tax=Chromera velia CCMP2878 TaxID=1169474 RepID=A0A0G4FF62_9ALVE|eukprot:Cvel_3268.t1-p1 / transcript=Cvel_3268.t1 / gene=Cvel_3268 / organism=Chromera_velia_CCMP2878 / gene_product=hypothetical protein / transcript_product=hypothetical protein / location=Cvel_scaffold128:65841-67460(+) / protein_length=204 / sequence_SO=supercontig / SO=protein_coding / is_pseudo=false